MRRALTVLTIAAVVLARAPVRADDLLTDRFRDFLDSLRRQAGIPGLAAALVGNNDILWERAFGRQDIERSIATRTDTPFHLDGVTQIFAATMALRCVEEGTLDLDEPIGKYEPGLVEPGATIRQLLSHTYGGSDNLVFFYRPERLEPLRSVLRACTEHPFRESLANLLERLAMFDSVPGPDVVQIQPPAEGFPTADAVKHYTGVLERLAVPYAVDNKGRPSPSAYSATTLFPAGGLISTVRDVAQFVLALRKGVLLRPETLAAAWRAPLAADGQRLPHGLGWFVQSFNGEAVIWQFGAGDNGSSSLIVTVPSRGLTLILLANSTGLAKPFPLAAGDLTVSPFGRLFLGLFVR